jgi:serine protease Do
MRHLRPLAFLLLASLLPACAQAPVPAPHDQRVGNHTTSRDAALANPSQDFRVIINSAKAKVFPAVVFIKCVIQDYQGGQKTSHEVSGSGVIISPKGEVLTNWHVVDKAVEVRCLLLDGQAMDAKVLGSDKDADLALLQLLPSAAAGGAAATKPASTPPATYPYAKFGDSAKLEEGDFVMAMGAPWGMSRSVSLGIISCTKRYLPNTSEYSIWLQTDAAISPGNSGGPLVSSAGEVVGINTLGMSGGGEMGFAVPSVTILPVIEQIRAHGKVNWSWTGLQLQPLKDFNRNVYFDGHDGVIVADTDLESPARRAGLQSRDRILKINGLPVSAITDEDLPELRRLLGTLPKNTPTALDVLRGTEHLTIPLTPREKGVVEGESFAALRWDCTVKTINQFDNPDLYFQRKQGLFVFGLKYPGNAAISGLETQDILLKVDGKPVTTLAEFQAAHRITLDNYKDKPRIVLSVLRNGLLRQIVLDISRDYAKE